MGDDVREDGRPIAPRRTMLVVGLGNEHRGDDAVGLMVARLLRPRLTDAATVLELDAEGTELLEAWEGREFVVVVDAVASGRPAGTVVRFEAGSAPLPSMLGRTSTHGISLAEAVGFAEALHTRPRHLVIYGVEAASFEPGAGISAPVGAAIEAVALRIEREVRSAADGPSAGSVPYA